jgi:DNA-binding Xre family transcriptional regulator
MTVEKVIEIKRLIKQGIRGTKLAEMFGVSQQVISDIKLGKCWGHVLLVEEEAVEHL